MFGQIINGRRAGAEAEACFTDAVALTDFDDVSFVRDSRSDQAGSVQVILGKTYDSARDRERELTAGFESASGSFRPDLLSGMVCIAGDGTFAQAFCSTSDNEARTGQQQEMPGGLRQGLTGSQAITTWIRFLDFTEPWLCPPT